MKAILQRVGAFLSYLGRLCVGLSLPLACLAVIRVVADVPGVSITGLRVWIGIMLVAVLWLEWQLVFKVLVATFIKGIK